MASTFVLVDARLPDGTMVYANAMRDEPIAATVAGGQAVFTGLRELCEYVAHATVNGRVVITRFKTDGGSSGAGSSMLVTEPGETSPEPSAWPLNTAWVSFLPVSDEE